MTGRIAPLRRRTLLAAALALPGASALAQPTPACGPATRRQALGPYFLDGAPERASLRGPGLPGTPTLLAGRVLDRSCRPVAGARVDLWHADDRGEYDVRGPRGRGRVLTGADGGYSFETVRPGLYPGRTRHFHLRVAAPEGTVLVTQSYFPDEPGNARDGLFHPSLVMATSTSPAGLACRFDIVLATA